MNKSERFFRRYIFSIVSIIILFLFVNILLVASFFAAAYLGNVKNSNFPIEDFSNHITETNGQFNADIQAEDMLNNACAWAMILDENGNIIWEMNVPEELPRHYSTTDVAMFSRWYLNSYPVNIWNRQGSLLVVGFPQGYVTNYYTSIKTQYVRPIAFGFLAAVCINVLLMLYLFVRNAHRIEKAMEPILNGIRHLSSGHPVHLEENGELAEINAGLNKAGDYLLKKDNTRAEWIRGISHDIRTPLSMILGYASEIEETSSLPETTRKQAEIIRKHSEKLKNLVENLNLTTKLEYSMQPMQKQTLVPVELTRQAVSEVLNDGLSDKYELELSEDNPGKAITITGDQSLLNRMLCNLIRNCIVHNPNGCRIQVSVGSCDRTCTFSVIDNGCGISEPQLNTLNNDRDISSTQKQTGEIEHGLGLKIVRQIVKIHQGTIQFSDTAPHGLSVEVVIPIEIY